MCGIEVTKYIGWQGKQEQLQNS